MTLRRIVAGAVLGLCVTVVAGCGGSKSTAPPPPPGDVPPTPNSPVNAVLLLEWALEHRDTTQYRTLFTANYGFAFVPGDTAATNHYGGPWGYAQERTSAAHLFDGGSPGGAQASTIAITTSGTLIDVADPRPGMNPTWHRLVTAPSFSPTIDKVDHTAEQIVGGSTFYLVRGDSATLPADLVAAGVPANSSRWFILAWQDQTGGVSPNLMLLPGSAPARATAVNLPTWGALKVRYLSPAP
jgi:hypothetical protein